MSDQQSPEPVQAPVSVPETLALTPAAVEWVKRIRTKEGKEGQALRLGVKADLRNLGARSKPMLVAVR